jgi:hypothetical protein
MFPEYNVDWAMLESELPPGTAMCTVKKSTGMLTVNEFGATRGEIINQVERTINGQTYRSSRRRVINGENMVDERTLPSGKVITHLCRTE